MSCQEHRNRLRKLVFIHIPKTAGLSLHSVLEQYFGETASVRFGNKEDRIRFQETTKNEFRKYSYISGHLSLKEIKDKFINYPTVALVRDPIKRLLSLLQYFRESGLVDHQSLKFDSVEAFADYMGRTGQINMQCWHLSGTQKFEDAVDMIHRNHLYMYLYLSVV